MKNIKFSISIKSFNFSIIKFTMASAFLLISIFGHSQTITKKGNAYLYDGLELNKNTIESVLKKSDQALLQYIKSQRSKKTAKILGYSTIGSLAVSQGLLYRGKNSEGFEGLNDAIFGTAFLVVGATLGTISLVTFAKYKTELRNSIDIYNNEIQNDTSSTESIGINVSATGVGLSYHF